VSDEVDAILLRLPRRGGAQHVLDVLASLLGAMLAATYDDEYLGEARNDLVEVIDRAIAGNRGQEDTPL
jgi:hypothetical protein